ncbi:hypothetical protein [Hyphomicrobium sp. ghe19]|uniref:hypothetical protein n=1 Tax=Hyphomicrobium sp. ghe19 TaxID=2682968 RepID=UPI001366EF26|nr:hypothetical protein HYPP_02495 [Hyphomicrobium sp. ghe19]
MPERQCGTCTRQKEWGCTAKRWRTPDPGEDDGPENWIRPSHLVNEFDGEQLYSCPRQTLREEPQSWSRLLMLYGMYLKGHLPNAGAVVDQSNVLIQSFRILDEANAECDQELAEQERRRQSRAVGPGATKRR